MQNVKKFKNCQHLLKKFCHVKNYSDFCTRFLKSENTVNNV